MQPAARGCYGEVRKTRTEDGSVGDAAAQAWVAEKRTLGPHGEEPQAGDRDRLERGARERREGADTQAVPKVIPIAIGLVQEEGVTVAVDVAFSFGIPVTRARGRPVRYAVVGLGHIAQVAILPAFEHARRNSRLVALVSNDATKLKTLARKYDIERTYRYDDFDACLPEVDAVYIALPNSMHAEYTIRAARAGVHVLCEKPMAVTAGECEAMIAACRSNRVKLMIAYRLHFEGVNLKAVDLVRQGRIGTPKFFNSSFALTVKPDNIRTKKELGGGTLYDIGVYCINAARYLFRAEPQEVMAISVNGGNRTLREIDESTGALLRFDGDRVAAFVTSFNAADVASYRIVGTKGQLHVDPAYEYAEGLAYTLTINGKTTRAKTGKHDQFAPELLYFSDCIQQDREPEPSGEEGLQDVRIIEALYQSAARGKAISIPPIEMPRRPSGRQRIIKPPVNKPEPVKARSASK
ncbi:MAG TPA: Gfo/Idh/MocA family oxidoreductase [Vicinamibacterales bacterium]|nr:Gfo/Idh/MocA family oxidoreductase [Vicinamibacterales bacterium]